MTRMTKRTLAIGVTGGIGSGKTEVCRIFQSLGAKVFYADTITKELIDTDPTIIKNIRRTFGTDVFTPDGKLDRKRLATLVFQNHFLREKLNKIVHPTVLRFLKRTIQNLKISGQSRLIVVEAALIYEAHGEHLFDYIVVVEASEEQRVDRLLKRDQTNLSEIMHRIKAQLSAEEKQNRADFIIENTGSLKSLEKKCTFLYRLLTRMTKTAVRVGKEL